MTAAEEGGDDKAGDSLDSRISPRECTRTRTRRTMVQFTINRHRDTYLHLTAERGPWNSARELHPNFGRIALGATLAAQTACSDRLRILEGAAPS